MKTDLIRYLVQCRRAEEPASALCSACVYVKVSAHVGIEAALNSTGETIARSTTVLIVAS